MALESIEDEVLNQESRNSGILDFLSFFIWFANLKSTHQDFLFLCLLVAPKNIVLLE